MPTPCWAGRRKGCRPGRARSPISIQGSECAKAGQTPILLTHKTPGLAASPSSLPSPRPAAPSPKRSPRSKQPPSVPFPVPTHGPIHRAAGGPGPMAKGPSGGRRGSRTEARRDWRGRRGRTRSDPQGCGRAEVRGGRQRGRGGAAAGPRRRGGRTDGAGAGPANPSRARPVFRAAAVRGAAESLGSGRSSSRPDLPRPGPARPRTWPEAGERRQAAAADDEVEREGAHAPAQAGQPCRQLLHGMGARGRRPGPRRPVPRGRGSVPAASGPPRSPPGSRPGRASRGRLPRGSAAPPPAPRPRPRAPRRAPPAPR